MPWSQIANPPASSSSLFLGTLATSAPRRRENKTIFIIFKPATPKPWRRPSRAPGLQIPLRTSQDGHQKNSPPPTSPTSSRS